MSEDRREPAAEELASTPEPTEWPLLADRTPSATSDAKPTAPQPTEGDEVEDPDPNQPDPNWHRQWRPLFWLLATLSVIGASVTGFDAVVHAHQWPIQGVVIAISAAIMLVAGAAWVMASFGHRVGPKLALTLIPPYFASLLLTQILVVLGHGDFVETRPDSAGDGLTGTWPDLFFAAVVTLLSTAVLVGWRVLKSRPRPRLPKIDWTQHD